MKEIIQKALSKGVEMHVAGQFDLAGQLYETVLKLQPDHADANHNMGLLKLDIGDDLEALPYLQTALQADISVAQFWLSYTKALIKLEKFDEVARILDLAKENGIEGEEFLESNQLVKSVTKSGKAIQAEVESPSPSDPSILDSLKLNNALRLAEKMAKDDNNEEAKKIYKDIVAKFPKNKRAQKNLTTLNKSQQSNATQGPPQETLDQLINLYDQGQLAAVIEQANTLTRQYPKAIAVWNVLGAAAAQTGQLAQAINAFKKITVIKPDNAQAYNNLGIALQQQGKLEEAVAAYKKALVINPNSANAYNNMGITLKHQGKLDEAIASYNKALALKPNYVEAAKNLVQLPIGSIGEKTISGLNKKSSSISEFFFINISS